MAVGRRTFINTLELGVGGTTEERREVAREMARDMMREVGEFARPVRRGTGGVADAVVREEEAVRETRAFADAVMRGDRAAIEAAGALPLPVGDARRAEAEELAAAFIAELQGGLPRLRHPIEAGRVALMDFDFDAFLGQGE